MTISYKNIRGEDYYIRMKLTKKGNNSYFMTRKVNDDCLNDVPDGYEVFERYDSGMMFIRKKKKVKFTTKEIEVIEKELKRNKSVFDFKLDICGNLIKIFTMERNEDDGINDDDTLNRFFGDKTLLLFKRFDERMRIYKKGKDVMLQRYCYRGSIDDWITIDYGEDFEAIIKSNLRHLGKESYYDLV